MDDQHDEGQRFVAEASVLLAGSLDYQTTLTSIAWLVVPRLADWFAVDLVEGRALRSLVVAHKDPAKVRFAEEMRVRYPPDPDEPRGVFAVVRSGRSEIYPVIPREVLEAGARDDEHRRIIHELRLHSAMVVPLRTPVRTLGAITFITSEESRREYGAADLDMAEELGRRAGVAIEHALLYAAEREARAHAEAAQERYGDLVNGLDGIVVWEVHARDPSLPVRFVSAGAQELLGWPLDSWYRRGLWDELVPPDEREAFRARLVGGGHERWEHRLLAEDGRTLWFQTDLRPVPEDGVVRGVSIDITRQKQAERELRSYALEQAAVAELGQRALAATELGPLLDDAVRTAVRVLGASAGGLLQVDPEEGGWLTRAVHGRRELLPTGLAASALQTRAPVQAHGPVSCAAVPIVLADRAWGVLLVADERRRSLGEDETRFLETVAHILGETIGRAEAERALRDSEDRMRMVVEALDDYAIFTLDPEGRVAGWNAGAEQIHGYRAEEIIGRDFSRFYLEEDIRLGKPARELEIAGTGGRFEDEGWRVRKDGSRLWAEVFTSALRDGQGRVRGFVKIMRDATARKLAEEERARLLGEAQEAVRARDEFLSIASHELNTPLTSLQLQVQSILRTARREPAGDGTSFKDRIVAKLAISERQVERLSKLITELLDVGRISGGRLSLEVEAVDLCRVVRDVTSRFAEDVVRAGSTLVVDVEGTLVGRWDRLRLEQIVTNLMSNAIKYGAGRPITVRVEEAPGEARLIVKDEGIGIAEDEAARIFGRFERAVSSRSYGGLGLGLYIVRQILDAMGGSIDLESTPGQGATFTVTLPRP